MFKLLYFLVRYAVCQSIEAQNSIQQVNSAMARAGHRRWHQVLHRLHRKGWLTQLQSCGTSRNLIEILEMQNKWRPNHGILGFLPNSIILPVFPV